MTKWEYKTLNMKPDHFNDDGAEELTALGREGWECIGVTSTGRGSWWGWWGSVGRVVCVLKRSVTS